MFNKLFLAYVKEEDFVAGVVSINLVNQTVTLKDENEELGDYKIEDVVLLQEIGMYNENVRIFDRDVFKLKDDSLVEIELVDEGEVILHALNEKLERIESSVPTKHIEETIKHVLASQAELIGSIFELEVEEDNRLDFNVKIVKDHDGQHFTYFYACNNKDKEEIDLIKVLYMGHQLLEEEDYERRTLSYDVFLDSLEAKTLTEVSPQELHNFVLGATYGQSTEVAEDDCEEEEVEEWEESCEEESCDDCEEERPW